MKNGVKNLKAMPIQQPLNRSPPEMIKQLHGIACGCPRGWLCKELQARRHATCKAKICNHLFSLVPVVRKPRVLPNLGWLAAKPYPAGVRQVCSELTSSRQGSPQEVTP